MTRHRDPETTERHPATDPCWRCGGQWAPYCCGDPPAPPTPGQADLLEELEDE